MTLKEHISGDLAARMKTGSLKGCRLTLQGLADEYNVSLTPVRQAVSELVKMGLISREDGHLTVCPVRHGHARKTEPTPIPTVPQDNLELIAQDMVRLSLQSQPVFLREEASAKRYGTTRSVIRQAFATFAGSGLLDHCPRRGWRLKLFSLKDLNDFLVAREALELKSLDLAKSKLVTSDLQHFLSLHSIPEGNHQVLTDNSFHRYIIDMAENRYISSFFEQHGPYFELLFDWEAFDQTSRQLACRQHRGILEALIAKDWRQARKCLSEHILHNHQYLNAADFSKLTDASTAASLPA